MLIEQIVQLPFIFITCMYFAMKCEISIRCTIDSLYLDYRLKLKDILPYIMNSSIRFGFNLEDVNEAQFMNYLLFKSCGCFSCNFLKSARKVIKVFQKRILSPYSRALDSSLRGEQTPFLALVSPGKARAEKKRLLPAG